LRKLEERNMTRLAVLASVLAAAAASTQAYAACTPLPYNLTNGSAADATQVMGDLNGILGCPLFTGNVGIGTTSPAASNVLTVVSTDNDFGKTVLIDNTNTGNDAQSGIQLTQGANTGYLFEQGTILYLWNAVDGPIQFNTNGSPQMILLGNGDVGIGTTTPTAQLHLYNAAHGGDLAISQQNDGTPYMRLGMDTSWVQYLANNAYWTGSAYDYVNTVGYGGTASRMAQTDGTFEFDTSSGGTNPISWNPRMYVANNGDVGIGTTSPTAMLYVNGSTFSTTGWSTASDGRLKEHVEPISGALDMVERLQGVRFKWLQPDGRSVGKSLALPVGAAQIGFVAQDVDKVVPEAVSKPAQGTDGVYGMDATKLIPLLVEALKEEQAEIAALKTKVARLESNSLLKDKGE
jgi:Chaperone of endosialidase